MLLLYMPYWKSKKLLDFYLFFDFLLNYLNDRFDDYSPEEPALLVTVRRLEELLSPLSLWISVKMFNVYS